MKYAYYIFKHFEDRGWPQNYHQYMVASINNCSALSENFSRLQKDFAISESSDNKSPFDSESPIADLMDEVSNLASNLLCEEVMLDLKVFLFDNERRVSINF